MRTNNTYLKLILMLAVVGLVVAGWLLSIHISFSTGQAGLTEGCGVLGSIGGNGCANVAVSSYSDVFGIPLAAIAMGYYATILLLVFWAMRNYQAAYEPLYTGFFLSTLAVVVTVVMFCIARFVLKSFCVGCSILWLVNLAVWPCFVKHLGLNWGNALGANLELVRKKELALRGDRIRNSLIAGVVCLVVFAAVGAAAKGMNTQANTGGAESTIVKDFEAAPVTFLPPEAYGGTQAKGALDKTPVLDIVEFADFQCPGCRMAAQFLKPFVMKNHDKVRITFRNFPLDGSCNPFVPNGQHSLACASARNAICAGQQGKFWDMHDQIYDNQESLSSGGLEGYVSALGLDAAKFGACLKDPATETQLQKDIAWGESIQLQSTPTLVINGKKMPGARPPAELEALLKHLESQKK
jgi:protein-disulfide isomerase/uncharacterized membrane protein